MHLFLFLSVTPSPKSTKFGSRYIVEGLTVYCIQDEIWQIDRGGLLYIRANFGAGVPLGDKILKSVKHCNAYEINERDEIWQR